MDRSEAGKLGYAKTKDKLLKHVANLKAKAQRKVKGKKCPNCKSPIPYEKRHNKFCSHSCAAQFNNSRRKKKSKLSHCLHCSKELGRHNQKYCSNRCQSDHAFHIFVNELEANGGLPYGSPDHKGVRVKRYLIQKNGHQCQICHAKIWQDAKIPLVLDHIDGNSSNWSLGNLRIICPNCDALLPTFKARNIGKGRHQRRVRYGESKSY